MKNKKNNPNLIVIIPIIIAIIGCLSATLSGSASEIIKGLINISPSETISSPVEAVIKFVVLDKATGENITGATITLQIDVMPSETKVTDTDGVARFFLKPDYIGLHGFLQIEADGYKAQKRDIDIDEKKPIEIYLEPADPTPSTIIPNSSNETESENIIKSYFEKLNNRDYGAAWAMLSKQFQKSYTVSDYISYWETVEKTEIILIDVKSYSSTQAIVYTEVLYTYKNGAVTTAHTTYKLIKSDSGWLFDPN